MISGTNVQISKCNCLPSLLDDFKVMTKGELETELVIMSWLGFYYWIMPIILWYCSWIKPKDLEFKEYWHEESSLDL